MTRSLPGSSLTLAELRKLQNEFDDRMGVKPRRRRLTGAQIAMLRKLDVEPQYVGGSAVQILQNLESKGLAKFFDVKGRPVEDPAMAMEARITKKGRRQLRIQDPVREVRPSTPYSQPPPKLPSSFRRRR